MTPSWTPYTELQEHHMIIKPDREIRKGVHKIRMYFWERMFWEDHLKKIDRQAAAAQAAADTGYGVNKTTTRPVALMGLRRAAGVVAVGMGRAGTTWGRIGTTPQQ